MKKNPFNPPLETIDIPVQLPDFPVLMPRVMPRPPDFSYDLEWSRKFEAGTSLADVIDAHLPENFLTPEQRAVLHDYSISYWSDDEPELVLEKHTEIDNSALVKEWEEQQASYPERQAAWEKQAAEWRAYKIREIYEALKGRFEK